MAWTQTTITTKDASGNVKTLEAWTDGTVIVMPSNLLDAGGNLITPAQDGTDGNGIAQPSGGAGIRGWLSGIYNRLAAVVLGASTAKIGVVTTDQTTHGTTDLVAADITKVGGTALALGQTTKSASIPVVLPSDVKVKNTILGSQITVIGGSTLNALASNALALGSSAINWTQGQTADGYAMGRVQMTFKFQTGPTANTGFSCWFCKSQDGGSTFEDTSAAPCRPPDFVIPVTPYGGSTDTAAHTVSLDMPIPVGSWKCLLKSDGTGQTLTANNTDNILTITPITQQGNV